MSNSRCLRPELRWANERMSTHRQVTIIGTGPAGLTAALHAGRANLEPLVIEGIETGGQLMLTTAVENYPGFRDGIRPRSDEGNAPSGRSLRGDVRRGWMSARSISRGGPSALPWARTTTRREHTSDTIILATGASAKWLDLGVDKQLSGRGVSTAPPATASSSRAATSPSSAAVYTAMEEAIYLAKLASNVTVIHRRDTLRASKVMQDKARSMPSIKWIWNTEVIDIKDVSKGEVTSLVLRDVHTRKVSELARFQYLHRHRPHPEHPIGGWTGDAGRQRLHRHLWGTRARMSPVCLPPAMCRITCIARR